MRTVRKKPRKPEKIALDDDSQAERSDMESDFNQVESPDVEDFSFFT